MSRKSLVEQVCDRCSFTDVIDPQGVAASRWGSLIIDDGLDGIDLCPSCKTELTQWMNAKKR